MTAGVGLLGQGFFGLEQEIDKLIEDSLIPLKNVLRQSLQHAQFVEARLQQLEVLMQAITSLPKTVT